MASQTQPIIPVTMPIGGGYGGGYGNNGYSSHQLQHEIHADGQQTRNRVIDSSYDLLADGQQTRNKVVDTGYRLQHEINSDGNHTRDHVQHDTDEIRDNQRWDAEFTRRDIRNAQDAGSAATTAATIALRAAVDRNVDYLSNQAEVNSTKAATDATRVELTTMDMASDIKSAQTNNQNLTSAAFGGLGVQLATNVGGIHQAIISQSQSVLLGQKDREVKASDQLGAIQLLAQQNFQATQLAQAKDTASIQLQAAGYNKSAELQACNYFSKLEVGGLQNTAEILKKLCECCCEFKSNIAATQSIVVQSGANNSANVQQGQINSHTQQLVQAQQEALFAKLSAK